MELRKRKTLLDLDRLPTQKELREFFLANDWTARKPYDFDEWSQEKIEDKSYSESIFNKIWHKISRKHGQKAAPRCYTQDYPPEVLRSSVSDIVNGSVAEMVNEHPDVVRSIFDSLSDDFLSGGLETVKAVMTGQETENPQALTEDDVAKVDRFVDNAMDTLMNTVDYDNLVQVCREFGTPEDFSDIKTNYPRNEFEEKYNHTKAKTKVTFSTPTMLWMLSASMDKTKYMKQSGKSRYTKRFVDDMQIYYKNIGIGSIASMSQVQRVLLQDRFDFSVISQIAFFLNMTVDELTAPDLTNQQINQEQRSHYIKDREPIDLSAYDEKIAPILERLAHDIYIGVASATGRPERVSEKLIYVRLWTD